MPPSKQLEGTSESSQLEPTIDENTALQAHTLLCHLRVSGLRTQGSGIRKVHRGSERYEKAEKY
ncbi:hypothetical protein N7537_012333 [Penicillium hordei]|uniref:Uncharacterized protein n=1 Tax=Penicillium hordei TaxID=40994 RepID=A0AAD6DNG5_9EURO|nr:uncharacterized protein N7537_012333 [Penicillium hordei]KAJ5589655.1 hypothetical protein N7537_012333 [Penicillium hordei]